MGRTSTPWCPRVLAPATRRATTSSREQRGPKPGSHWSVQKKAERDCSDVKTLDEPDEVTGRDDAPRGSILWGHGMEPRQWPAPVPFRRSTSTATSRDRRGPSAAGAPAPGCSLCLQCTALLCGPAALLCLQQKST